MTTQEYKNEHFTAQMETLPNCLLRFSVQVVPERVKELRKKAVKAISKEVNVPGFRPGKAPEALIEKQYGKHVSQEFQNIASNETVSDIIKLTKKYPLKKEGSVNLEKFETNDEGTKVVFSYETYPTVPDVKVDGITFTTPEKKEITEKDIDKTIKEIQLYHAAWEEVKDRAVQEGDFVVIDIDVLDEPPFKAYEDSRFHVIEKGMPVWARKLVIGMKAGESVEGISELDTENEANNGDEEFVSRKCLVTVKLIQSAVLPEVNEELAAKAGVQTVEELRKNIRAQMERESAKNAKTELRFQARDHLIKNYMFDLPKEDLKNLEADCRQMIERDKAQMKTPEDMQTYKEKLFANGEGVIRLAYLIPHLANQLDIQEPSPEDANSRMIEVLTQYYLQTQKQVPEDQYTGIFQKIQRDLLAEHTLDKLIEINMAEKV